MERGLSSESSSVSSPPTPSVYREYILHLESSKVICMDYHPVNKGLAVEHIGDFDSVLFGD